MGFIHLHTHTEYSLLDGSNKIKSYVAKCKSLGMNAAAITDHGAMYGVIDFYKECKKNDINPVLGCEVYVAPNSRFDREPGVSGEDRYYHLILLAENNEGYQNLIKIVSAGFVDGFYYKPRVDFEILEKYHEGIICLSACLAGEVARFLNRGLYEEAKKTALKYRNLFGENNYFLEMQDHGIAAQQEVNQGLMRLSNETGIPLVCTNDCHYTNAEDAVAHDILLCIQTGKKVSDEDRMRYEGGQYFVKSEEEMLSLFPYAKEAVLRTQEIADRCHVEIEFGVTKLPHFEVPEGYDSWTYLNKLCFEGLERRYGDGAKALEDRLNYELSTIKTMGYVDYFLIVWDFINYARTHGIPVGPGRGSAAGSLVSYTTGITNIDPIKYSLLFERFLNPERVSMPDIDIDFCFERRSQVIDYVVDKYGKDCVSQIVTFGTMKAKNAIRDVGRVLDLPYALCDKVAKMIPNELGITIDGAIEMNRELRDYYESDEEIRNLIDMAKALEGLPRHTSMHAAGVVISQLPMDEYVPLSRASDGTITTQFTMTTIEELGLLKMDFLGLRTLTVIDEAVKLVEKNYGVKIDIDAIDQNDPKVLALIASGKTEGIFQLESAGMKSFMRELSPECLEDVIAGISLYRPGPMEFIPNYIRGKRDKASIVYDCPQMEPILAPTYGCIVYQEQVMQIVRDLAGYSMGRSDLVRRAMSKKKADVMAKERQNFVFGNAEENVAGCVNNGIDESIGNKIYDDMTDFAKYAFNKSHAAAYAVVAYETAYLKCYYPAEFMAALMTSVIDNGDKVSAYIQVCRDMGIEVLPPDINEGGGVFSVKDGKIRYGMNAIKNIGPNVIAQIVAQRENGPYTSLSDFIGRVVDFGVNKRAVENLIKAGACDCLDGNRRQMIMVYQSVMDDAASEKKNGVAGQMSFADLFGGGDQKTGLEVDYPDVDEFPKEVLLGYEKEVLGIYVSGHPLEEYLPIIDANVTASSLEFVLDAETGNCEIADNKEVVIAGIINNITIKFTKNNKTMAFLDIEDLVGNVEVIVFPQDYERNRISLVKDSKVLIYGRASVEEDKNAKLIASSVVPFEQCHGSVWVRFADKAAYDAVEQEFIDILSPMDGKDTVKVYIEKEKLRLTMPPHLTINGSPENISKLRKIYGEKNVEIVQKKVEFNTKRH